jgi:hypothetical protein
MLYTYVDNYVPKQNAAQVPTCLYYGPYTTRGSACPTAIWVYLYGQYVASRQYYGESMPEFMKESYEHSQYGDMY